MGNQVNTIMKRIPLVLACGLMSAQSYAGNDAMDESDKGKVEAELKAMHIFDADSNGYDPSSGTSYLVKLKYVTPQWNKARLGIGFYDAGDLLNMTDFGEDVDPTSERTARGMFVAPNGEEKSLLGEFYVNYTGDNFEINAGRQLYTTPLTDITYSTMPNFHTVFGISTTAIQDLKLSFDQVTQMSFGARAATDYALIGEGTRTAGASFLPVEEHPSGVGLEQAKFYDISIVALGEAAADDTNGISVLGATYTGLKGASLSAWDYYAEDVSNTFYAEADYGMPVGGFKLKLSAQYMKQNDNGNLVDDANFRGFEDGIDYSLVGLKAMLKGGKWMAFAAYNKSSGDTGMFNSWGGDPAYTSSIFSRNAYRENVSAYKIGVKYNILKNFFVMLSHADYGQSDTVGTLPTTGGIPLGAVTAQTDAKETDLVFVYMPMKKLMLKLFHANRTSEYDGFNGAELTQAHTRLVASYKF